MKKSILKKICMISMLAFAFFFSTQMTYAADKIPEGVHVNGHDVSGMTHEEVKAFVEQYMDEVCKGHLEIIGATEEEVLQLEYKDIDLKVDENQVVNEICSIGEHGNLIVRYKELADVKNNQSDYRIPFSYNEKKLDKQLKKMIDGLNREAKDATLVRHSGEFILTDEIIGIKADTQATVKQVKEALSEKWNGEQIQIKVTGEFTEPVHKVEELSVIKDLLGSYSTNFSSSSSSRCANVANGARLIDEIVLYPGETFSFLNHVVPFTLANGYQTATGYAGGKVVPSVGGGICQVSSTLYNTVLRAELEIVQRDNHGMTVGYVPLGADATVAEGVVDFKFKNNLTYPIYIEAYTYNKNIYVNIYGKEERPDNREIEFYSVTEKTIEPGEDVITKDDTKDEDFEEVTQTAHRGYVASFYKRVLVDGKEIETIKINTSSYRATPRYVTVGTKKPETEASETEKEKKKENTEE